MIFLKKRIGILILVLTILSSCRISYTKTVNKEKNLTEKTKEELNQEMIDYFKEEQVRNERKFDSLKIKEDSLRNKSTLAGFMEDVPVFNETTEIKEK